LFSTAKWLRERATLLRYTYIAYSAEQCMCIGNEQRRRWIGLHDRHVRNCSLPLYNAAHVMVSLFISYIPKFQQAVLV